MSSWFVGTSFWPVPVRSSWHHLLHGTRSGDSAVNLGDEDGTQTMMSTRIGYSAAAAGISRTSLTGHDRSNWEEIAVTLAWFLHQELHSQAPAEYLMRVGALTCWCWPANQHSTSQSAISPKKQKQKTKKRSRRARAHTRKSFTTHPHTKKIVGPPKK